MNSSSDGIDERLRQYLIDDLGLPPAVTLEDNLVKRGLLASAQLIDVVVFVEDEFGVLLRPIDIVPEKMESIASIASVVRERMMETKI